MRDSLGKVITAFQNEAQREKLLRSYGFWHFTERSITDRGKLEEEFSRVRAQKFATDREESVPDGICFGVPVFNPAGEVNVALSTSFPKMRVRDAEHEKAIIAALRATAENISADLHAFQAPETFSKPRGAVSTFSLEKKLSSRTEVFMGLRLTQGDENRRFPLKPG